MLRKLTIKHKVYTLALLGALLALGISGEAIYSMNAVGKQLKQVAEEDIPLTASVTEITIHQLEQAISFERAARYAEIMAHNPSARKNYEASKEKFLKLAHQVDEEIKQAEAQVAGIIEHEVNHGGAQYIIDEFRHVEEILHKIEKKHASFDKHVEEVFALFEMGRLAEAEHLAEKVEAEEDALDHELEALLLELERFTAEAASQANDLEKRLQKVLLISSAIATILFLIAAYFIVRGIVKPLLKTKEYADALSRGDLDTPTPEHSFEDEIADMMQSLDVFRENAVETEQMRQKQIQRELEVQQMQEQAKRDLADKFESQVGSSISALATAAMELQTTADSMSSIAGEASQASQTVAASSQSASSNVNTVAAAMEEMTASSSEIASQIASVNMQSNQASTNAQSASEKINALNSLVDNVDEVVVSIQGIAEQTNLLALNATIESARAGDAGKGFAVVAEEVKKLAGETGDKTDEISKRITEIQEATQAAVEAMHMIISSIGDIDGSVTGVSAAVEEQNATTAEITCSIAEASQETQNVSHIITEVQTGADQTQSSAADVLNAAAKLSELSETLSSSINEFLRDVRGENDSTAADTQDELLDAAE